MVKPALQAHFSECQILGGEMEQVLDIENTQEENQDSKPDSNLQAIPMIYLVMRMYNQR